MRHAPVSEVGRLVSRCVGPPTIVTYHQTLVSVEELVNISLLSTPAVLHTPTPRDVSRIWWFWQLYSEGGMPQEATELRERLESYRQTLGTLGMRDYQVWHR